MQTEKLDFFKNLFYSLLRDVAQNENEEISTEETSDDVDKALTDRDNLLLLKLQGRQNFYVKKIVDSLSRIHNGTFGTCEDCGEEIEYARLLARPMTTLCISCKEEEEKVEGQIPYHKRSHTHGKTLQTKNNIQLNADDSEKERILEREKNDVENRGEYIN